jgi:hypothetical protein
VLWVVLYVPLVSAAAAGEVAECGEAAAAGDDTGWPGNGQAVVDTDSAGVDIP